MDSPPGTVRSRVAGGVRSPSYARAVRGAARLVNFVSDKHISFPQVIDTSVTYAVH